MNINKKVIDKFSIKYNIDLDVFLGIKMNYNSIEIEKEKALDTYKIRAKVFNKERKYGIDSLIKELQLVNDMKINIHHFYSDKNWILIFSNSENVKIFGYISSFKI